MQTDKIASTHLGKKSKGSERYSPSLLVAIPREENRKQYGITPSHHSHKLGADVNEFANIMPAGETLFKGYDIWHAYEFSCLTENGIPVTRVIKLRYDCTSKYIVESKSLKLYLNSFNMTRLGKTVTESLEICKKLIEKDLSEKLETKVLVNFLDNIAKKSEIFLDFKNIMDLVDESNIEISSFKETPELLEVETCSKKTEYRLTFDSLRSNCRVTHQPDFGDVFIYYKSKKHIKEDSLLKYLVSFRSEYHFHEECCEMIFKRISDLLGEDDSLMVCALYTRRGGIDISPFRYRNCNIKDIENLADIKNFTRYGIKQ